MRRSAVVFLLTTGLPTVAHAQSDAPATAPASTAPAFHAGQWAARFGSGYGFYGIGAMHFSSPTKAWTLFGQVNGGLTDYPGDNSSSNGQAVAVNVGRRWYRPTNSRVRTFRGLGLMGNFSQGHQVSGLNRETDRAYGAGLFGELGATVFLIPELSLGATWNASLGASRTATYVNGGLVDKRTSASLSAGSISVEGAFYF